MEINLHDLPTEIIQKIIYVSISAHDFINLGLVCKELNLVTGLINYPGMTEYTSIKKIKNKSRFKALKVREIPEEKHLDEISPVLLEINYSRYRFTHISQNSEVPESDQIKSTDYIIIPESVVTLSSYCTNIDLDPKRNTMLKNLICINADISGTIPKSVENIDLNSNTLKIQFEDPANIKIFNIYSINMYGQSDYPQIYNFVKNMTNIKSFQLSLYSVGQNDTVYIIPENPKLTEIVLQISGKDTRIALDFSENKNVKRLAISSQCPVEIINPPTNLEMYFLTLGKYPNDQFYAAEQDTELWNNSLNLSAEDIYIKSQQVCKYICDNRVKKIELSDKAQTKFSDTVELCYIVTEEDVEINDTKNIKKMHIKANNIKIDLGNILELYIDQGNTVELVGMGQKLQKLHLLCNKAVGTLSIDGPCQMSKYQLCDVSEFRFYV
jgi:hypothetical protein